MPTTIATTPVEVSRIQNRRGTQSAFDALYSTYPGTGTQILQPGELAICTDTRRLFIGNTNGEYVELSTLTSGISSLSLAPLVITLAPTSTPTLISQLVYTPTPFLSILYSISDTTSATATTVGTNYAKNGEFKVTALAYSVSTNTTSLTDIGNEINTTSLPSTISFTSNYVSSGSGIGIYYTHNFPGVLTLSTSTIVWQPI